MTSRSLNSSLARRLRLDHRREYGVPPRPATLRAVRAPPPTASSIPDLQHRQERLLRDLDRANLLHPLLPLLLLLQQLPLPGDVAAVALGGHVLPQRLDRLPRDHLAADRCLDRDLEQLPRDQLLQLLRDRPAVLVRLVPVDDHTERVDRVAVD